MSSDMDDDEDEASQLVVLNFSGGPVREPIINNIRQQFGIMINDVHPDLSDSSGWEAIEVTGNDRDIDEAIAWMTSKGVRVYSLSINDENSGLNSKRR